MRIHRNVLFLAVAAFSYAFCAGYLAWFMPLHVSQVAGEALMSAYFSAARLLSGVAVPVCGILSDIVGRKPMVVASFLSFAAGVGLLALYPGSPLMLLASIALFALAPALHGGALPAMLAESVDERVRGRVMSLFPVVGLVGSSSGSAALGLLAEAVGSGAALVAALAFASASLVSSLFLAETGVRTRAAEVRMALRNPLAGIRSVFLDRSLYPLVLIAALWGLNSRMFSLFLSPYLSRVAGFDAARIGLLFSATMVAQAIGQPASGWFVDKYGCVKALLLNEVGSGALVLAFVAVTTAGGQPLAALAVFPILMLSASLSAFGNTAYQVHIAKVTDPGARATVYSAVNSLSMLAGVASPILGYMLWSAGPQLVYVASSTMSFSCVPLVLMLRGARGYAEKE